MMKNNNNFENLHPNKQTKYLKDHPIKNILGNIESIAKIRNQLNK